MSLGVRPRGASEARAQGGIVEEPQRRRGHGRAVADGVQEADLAVEHHLGHAPDARGDDGHAAGEGLERGEAEALGLAGQQEDGGVRERAPGRTSRSPTSSTSLATPSVRASSSTAARSGPSPTRRRRAGRLARTIANTRTTSVTRLSARKFETWTITGGAAGGPSVGSKRSVSTKFGTTSIESAGGRSRLRRVTSASQREGTVTASLPSTEKRVSGRNVGSMPTSVVSVPCKVVTTRGADAGRSAASTWRASSALTAWGSA